MATTIFRWSGGLLAVGAILLSIAEVIALILARSSLQ